MSSGCEDKAAYFDVPAASVACSRPVLQLRPGLEPFFRGSGRKTLIRRIPTSFTSPPLQRETREGRRGGRSQRGRPAPARP